MLLYFRGFWVYIIPRWLIKVPGPFPISGTSNIWSKSGPVYLLIITKMLQRIQETLWNHPEKYYLCQYGLKQFRTYSKNVCPTYNIFLFFC